MNTSREDRKADARHSAFLHSDRSQREDDAFDDGGKPGRSRRRPPGKARRRGAFSDDSGQERRQRRGNRRGPAGYDRHSDHDRLRDYPRRHDWRDPAADLDDDELL